MLVLISNGFSNREIGTRLSITEETVKGHVGVILTKFQARSRGHAVAIGFRSGLLGDGPAPTHEHPA